MNHSFRVFILLLAAASPAAAQDPVRGFVRGFGGVTFMSETAGVFGAGAGVRIHDRVEIFGEVGRMTNVLPHSLQRDLVDAARAIGPVLGLPLSIDGQAPAVYGFGALRFIPPMRSKMRIYVEAGGGTVYGESRIRAYAGSTNVSGQVVPALGIKDSETAPLLLLGGGVAVPATHNLSVDVGYRFMRIFTDDPRINTANMTAGLRWSF